MFFQYIIYTKQEYNRIKLTNYFFIRRVYVIFASMRKIILITGGQRSGKSTYAEQLALSMSKKPVYIATAHIWDEEFRQRVLMHQERRGPQWENIEEEKKLSSLYIYNKKGANLRSRFLLFLIKFHSF